METPNFDYADDSEDCYEIVLLPADNCGYFPPEPDRLSPCHAILPPSPKLALANIQDFVETTIVLRKDKKNELGISVAGGADTYIEQLVVTIVHKDGAAYRDGRLKKGDVILAVNDYSLRDASFAEGVKLLRDAPSPLRLLVLRENPTRLFTSHESPKKFITVELRKANIRERLGISLIQKPNGRGVFVTYVPGSIAARHGRRILQGDQILEINGQSVRESNQKDVAEIFEKLDGAIVLLLGREPTLSTTIQEWVRRKAQQCLRTRTSTWSAYTGNNKEKLQAQRPSLPVSKETNTLTFTCTTTFPPCTPATICPSCSDHKFPSRDASPNSSIRRSRLGIVAENVRDGKAAKVAKKSNSFTDIPTEELEVDLDDFNTCGSENPLLPSIKVTSF